jgi:hypothetical protein
MNSLFTRKYLKEFPRIDYILPHNWFNHFDIFRKVYKKMKRANACISLIFWISIGQEYKMILKEVNIVRTSIN